MQLDNTRIAIRERNLLETLDLAFRVIREFWKPWLICSLLMIVPLAVLNYVLLRSTTVNLDFEDPNVFPFRYFTYSSYIRALLSLSLQLEGLAFYEKSSNRLY